MKTASETNKTTNASQYAHEDEHFWRKHLVAFPRSGLTKVAYCRENAINYNRFFYRINNIASSRRLSKKTSKNDNKSPHFLMTELLPVQLKQEPDREQHSVHCSISLKNGAKLTIHDQQSLLIILEKWS